MNNLKPGWKTSEFWISLSMQLLSLLVILGVVAARDRAALEESVTTMITAVSTLVSSAVVVVSYIRGRIDLKNH